MEKIFLIGGSGFIGKNLVRCLSPYYQISIFDKYIDHDFFADYPLYYIVEGRMNVECEGEIYRGEKGDFLQYSTMETV